VFYKPDDSSKQIPGRLKDWFKGKRGRLRKIPGGLKKIELSKIAEHSGWIRWGIVVLAIFLLSEIISRGMSLFIRPVYPPMPKKPVAVAPTAVPSEDYDAILRRNMFNVEGKIPEAFEQGLLDCMSQARPTGQRILLLGTIVMNDDWLSVALVQEEGNPLKIGVKKDEFFFDGKFQAMKIERKRLCFQVRATQEFEYVEIPEDPGALGVSTAPSLTGIGEGVTPTSETTFAVKKSFLDEKISNLNEILQTARAVPYTEPGTNKMKGFLMQSIDPGSPFAQLGLRQGDILVGVNDITLDNPGKGLEAFQRLRNSPRVSLEVMRGGQRTTLSYELK